ncbi:two-component regulator propeller domain-containing protein [Phocaeicola sp.]
MKNYLAIIHIFLYVVILCTFIISMPVKGSNIPQKYSVTYFSTQNGVEDGLVNDIIQDHKGLLWFATWNGLYRFDGYNFKNYKSNTEDKGGLTNDRLLNIAEDIYGCIWVLCYDSTCYRFNPNKEIFEPISQEPSNHFQSIKVFPNGIVWLLREDGRAIRILTSADNLSMTYQSYSVRDNTLLSGNIQSVFMDSKQREWILTDNGLYSLNSSELSCISSTSSLKNKQFAFNFATELDGELYFGADQGKIYKYSSAGELVEHCQLPTLASVISILKTSSRLIYVTDTDGFFIHTSLHEIKHISLASLPSLKNKTIESAELTSNDLLWFAHPVPGTTMFDMKTERLTFIEGKDELGRALDTESKFFTLEDKNGVLWVHPNGGGFSYFDPQNRELVPFNTTDQSVKWKSNDRCFAAFSDKQGNLWMSTQLNRLKRITFIPDKFHIYTPVPKDIELPDNEIRALYIDRKQRIWMGSRDLNVSVYDTHFNLLKRMQLGKVYAIMQDADGTYWISTKGEGLIRAIENPQGNFEFQHFTYKADDPFTLSSDNLYFTFQDSKKRLWVATYGGGLNLIETLPDGSLRFINHRNLLKQYPIDRFYKVRHITEDVQGRIWVSTTAGILFFDEAFGDSEDIVFHSICREQGNVNSLSNNDVQMIKCMDNGKIFAITYGGGLNELLPVGTNSYQCKAFTQKNGLISDIIYSMHEDGKGNLWLVTGGGLVKFIASQEQIQYPSEHIAFNMHFSEGVGATDGKQIFFGTNRGLFYFTPENIHKTDFVPQIFFSSIWMNNQELTPRKTPSILAMNPDDSHHIVLPPNNHTLRLVFSALDMTDTEYIQYAYKLEGFDKAYRLTDNGHEANYTNLPPGKYVFRVKSTNNEGVWGDNERTLSIEVLPTFYETPYATMLYVVLVLLFIICAIYIYTVFYRVKSKAKNEELIAQLKLSFFTDVSHELRTPLTLITGPLEYVLREENLPDNIKGTLNIIKKNSDRMQRLVGQILDFSKIQDRKMKLRIQYVDIVGFTQNIASYFDALALERHINLSCTSQLSEYYLWFDTDHIEKAIFNLLSNAFKYTPDGKNIQIYIEEQADSIFIHIKDEGTGIKKEKQETIFQRFETLAQNNIHNTLSSGIGLSVAKEFVEMHHGSISVESEPGAGSTFTVKLLKGKVHYPDDTEYILSDLSENTTTIYTIDDQQKDIDVTDKLLMLIVEDNHELRTFIRQIFQNQFRLIEADNGEDGLQKAFLNLPDIIITDIMMPVKDGIQMLQELRNDERTSHIPAIVLTAKTDMDSILIGIHTGADDYITKPFSISYLQAKVEALLTRRKMLQAYYCNAQYAIQEELKEEKASPQLSEKDAAFLNKLVDIMEQHISNPDLSVDQVVSHFSLSRTNFFHKLKSLTGLAPIMYIKEVRMRKAAELIKEDQYTMSEIAYMVGFSDPHYFSKSFKAFWGMTSTEFAKKQTKK